MRPRAVIAVIVAAIAVLHGAWILHYGIHWGEDIDRFSIWGDALIAHHFNPVDYLRGVKFVAAPILYLGWVYVVAVAKVVGGANWGILIVGLNWVAVILIAWLALRTVCRLTESTAALIVCGVLLANFEMLMFVNFPLSDILFLAIITVVLVFALRVAERPSAGAIAGGTAALLLSCIFRPAAAPVVVLWLAALLWSHLGPGVRRWFLPTVAALLIVVAFLQAAIMQDVARWPFHGMRGWFAYLKADYDQGMIVVGRRETWVSPPARYGDYLAMIFRRWSYFFAMTMRDYSTVHRIGNILYFAIAYALALAAVLLRPADARRTTATTLLLLMILTISAFHGFQEVDFDHRYRLPILPALIILAGFGAAEIARRQWPILPSERGQNHS